MAFTSPHWPLQAPEADIARNRATYEAGWDVIRTNRYNRQLQLGIIDKQAPLAARCPRGCLAEVPNKAWEANRMATYAAMIERMDAGIGQSSAQSKTQHIDQNTLVLPLADNGGVAER